MVLQIQLFITELYYFISICCWINYSRIFLRSYHFYKMFVPSNVPNLLKFPLVIIEIISHIAKILV